jgi:hypothetical protein
LGELRHGRVVSEGELIVEIENHASIQGSRENRLVLQRLKGNTALQVRRIQLSLSDSKKYDIGGD